jgi:hypothetical protein
MQSPILADVTLAMPLGFPVRSRFRISLAYAELILRSALKRHVLTGGWREADYLNEPGYV